VERPFVIIERATGAPVGSTRYLDIQRKHRTLEIGSTWLARRVWRSRVNTECKYLLLRHAFEELKVMRVQLKTDRRNARSRAAIERIGARFEGILRHHMLVRGDVVRDSACYGIIDTEWPEVKARLEELLARD
jgi:RimJ/RimL family protein N-acetyltransferase